MHAASLFLLLVFVTTLCGPLARVVRIPMPLLQIALGTIAALLGMKVSIEPDVFMLLFVPPLLFSDAFLMPMRELQEMRGVILGLAIGLVLFGTVAGGLFVHWLIPPIPLAAGFALAAVLSPTDAVAVSGMLEGRGAPRRLLHVLAGEALLNDATGLVCFRFAAGAALSGSFSFVHATGAFVVVSLVGVAVGIGGGLALALLQRWLLQRGFEHAPTFFAASALLPFATYLAAERLGASGILAAVAAGLAIRRAGTYGMTATDTRLGSAAIWNMLTFLLNGVVFVILGLQLPGLVRNAIALAHTLHAPLWRLPYAVVLITLVLVALRLVWIGGAVMVRRMLRRLSNPGEQLPRPTLKLALATAIAGVRGAITLAAVLSLQADFPSRDVLVGLATGVILFSLLLAAVCLPPLLRGEGNGEVDPHEHETDHARLVMAERAVDAVLEELETADDEHRPLLERLLEEVRAKRRRLELAAEDAPAEEREQQLATVRSQRMEMAIRLNMLRAERESLAKLNRDGAINDDIERTLMHELDHQEEVVLATARALPRALPRDHVDHPEHDARPAEERGEAGAIV